VRLEPTQAFTTLTVTATSFTTTNNLSLGSTLNNAPVVFDWGAAQTLTNNGTISINPGLTPTAPRALAGGYLINGKTLNVNGKATANHLSNTGTLNVAPTGSLTVRTYSGSGTLSGSVNLGWADRHRWSCPPAAAAGPFASAIRRPEPSPIPVTSPAL
jgi:hypothetical protein